MCDIVVSALPSGPRSRITPLGLSEKELAELLAFLQSLPGNNVDALVSDAHAAPRGGS